MTPIADRFMRYVDKTGPGGCWLWTGAKRPPGYGAMTIGSRRDGTKRAEQAHRISYDLYRGSIPAGMCVCHSCDNPSCVNPAHLWLGTPGDNARDRDQKDRVQHGQAHYAAKLTAADVTDILEQSGLVTQRELARRFRVDPSNISHILSGKRWKRSRAGSSEGGGPSQSL
jgi:hypothetical protein